MVESLEVKLARVEEKVDQVLRRLEAGDKRFIELDNRVTELERKMAGFMYVITFISFAVPLVLRYVMGG
jgi:hypothetical protein